mmetsp:Transcript_19435/g.42280  ORF Transcript_19435/g.42280 Transcript_19435/m.42280 type:complete len:251 (+) Transcript_19435:152-904(+)
MDSTYKRTSTSASRCWQQYRSYEAAIAVLGVRAVAAAFFFLFFLFGTSSHIPSIVSPFSLAAMLSSCCCSLRAKAASSSLFLSLCAAATSFFLSVADSASVPLDSSALLCGAAAFVSPFFFSPPASVFSSLELFLAAFSGISVPVLAVALHSVSVSIFPADGAALICSSFARSRLGWEFVVLVAKALRCSLGFLTGFDLRPAVCHSPSSPLTSSPFSARTCSIARRSTSFKLCRSEATPVAGVALEGRTA